MKIRKLLLTAAVVAAGLGLASCGKGFEPLAEDVKTIKVAASPTPHSEILKAAKPYYEAKGYTLEIIEYTDYVQPNIATEDGDVAANYFQHTPYLNQFNEEQDTHLVSVGVVHYEPLAIYKGSKNSLSDVANGDKILVPNDVTNEARALLLLEEAGLIDVRDDAGLDATKNDIISNPYNLEIKEMEAAQIAANRVDGAFAVINGNYALDADLTAADALKFESSTGLAAQTYGNILCVREGNENHPAILALYEVLTSPEIKSFIEQKYNGAVLAI